MFRRVATLSRTVSLNSSFRPLSDRVLVKKDSATRETASGLVLPKEEKVVQAKVLAAGPGKSDAPMSLKEGDRVLLPEWGGQRVTVDGQELHLYRESEILGVIQ